MEPEWIRSLPLNSGAPSCAGSTQRVAAQFSRFPKGFTSPPYHWLAYTVICNHPLLLAQQDDDDGSNREEFMALRQFGTAAAIAVTLAFAASPA